ncbi:hypothetical protein JHK82_053261 [Glycine max]|nr:hypothetical protein JHK86_053104 [Glycine max]KAG4927490.1 hypothetical protein JHK85_053976 [Glycine max]KAG5083089.1 hypothetical protein JHK84_053127 [Glycine max]KAG5085864.1 hypothetical protein JHK82_053261 [Glycine max]
MPLQNWALANDIVAWNIASTLMMLSGHVIKFPNLSSRYSFSHPSHNNLTECRHQPTTTPKPSNHHTQIIEAPSSSMSSTIVTNPDSVPPWKPHGAPSLSQTTHGVPSHFIPSVATPSSDPTIITPPRSFMAATMSCYPHHHEPFTSHFDTIFHRLRITLLS